MANRKKEAKGVEQFDLKDYKPLNGRLLITLNSESGLMSGSKRASILDYQKVVAIQDNDEIKVGDTVLLDIESLIQRYPEQDKDGKTIIKENLKIPAINLSGETYGEVRFVNLRGYFKENKE